MKDDYAWAIRCTYTELNGAVMAYLAGRYYFSVEVPDGFSGYTLAVFETRTQARKAAALLRPKWAWCGKRFKARVVRVKVEVTECPG